VRAGFEVLLLHPGYQVGGGKRDIFRTFIFAVVCKIYGDCHRGRGLTVWDEVSEVSEVPEASEVKGAQARATVLPLSGNQRMMHLDLR
jgi:hypothetical protein